MIKEFLKNFGMGVLTILECAAPVCLTCTAIFILINVSKTTGWMAVLCFLAAIVALALSGFGTFYIGEAKAKERKRQKKNDRT